MEKHYQYETDFFPGSTSDSGEVKAYTQEAIDSAFENAPSLVLRSAKMVSEVARQTPQLQQQFSDV